MNSFMRRSIQLITVLALAVLMSACGNGFLSTQPQDTVSLNNFYQTDKQVLSSTDILYGSPWFLFNDKFSWAAGTIMSGNGRTYSNDVASFNNFTFGERGPNATGSSVKVINYGWQSLWTVVAQANALINNLSKRAGPKVSQAALNQALGEAHVMRALAYFYLVRYWGPIPLIKNSLKHVDHPEVPRIKVKDIYTFIIHDLRYGMSHCKHIAKGLFNGGHITAGSAEALLSKVYLTTGNYKKADSLSQAVIQSGEFQLMKNYANLFKTSYNNNIETIIALQWSNAKYGVGNSRPAYFSYTTQLTGVGTGWAVLGPTISLQNAYESGDKREKWTIMLPGAHYPDLLKAQGGYTVPNDVNAQGTHAAIKKYVIGTPKDNSGRGAAQSRENQTYMLRFADVLLVNAEAAFRLGNTGQALKSINKIRERAGLPDFNASTLTLGKILHERRIELAIECQYWFELERIHNINPAKANKMIHNQERGTYANVPYQQHPPVIYHKHIDPANIQWLLSYPEVDVTKNPKLDEPPQSYDFSKNQSSNH